ncbi:MAG TPA: sodium/proline symporter [Gemmatimonadaceae bacterium]|nr:sodium/proline symporter [Gemmatimonadaceae bacterium]
MTIPQEALLPTRVTPLIVGTALVYFGVVGSIGLWASRRTRSVSDFYVAGRRLGLWTVAIASMAATISGFSFIGGPGFIYNFGFGAVFIVLPLSVTATMSAWVLGTRLRALAELRGVITVPDAIGVRYRSPAAQGLAGVAIVIAVVGYLATNVMALGIVVDGIFGSGRVPGIWIGMLITLAYSAAGGILAGVYADLFQGGVMLVVSSLVFLFVLGTGGGLDGISHAILAADPEFLSPWGKFTPLAALSLFFVFGLGTLGQPHVVHKFYMIRDPRRLRWYPVVMTASMVLAQLLFIGVGLVVKALVARGELPALARPDDATPTFLLGYTPPLLAALAFSGVAAAIMSTVNSFLSVGAAALTHDVPIALGTRLRNELPWGRAGTVLIAVTAAMVATGSQTLVAFLGIFGWGLFASTIVPSLAIGLNWPGATRAGAIASIVTGMVVTLGLETLAYTGVFRFPAGVTAAALALVSSVLVFGAVSHATRGNGREEVDPDLLALMDDRSRDA